MLVFSQQNFIKVLQLSSKFFPWLLCEVFLISQETSPIVIFKFFEKIKLFFCYIYSPEHLVVFKQIEQTLS